ncbi:MAG TPA: hypothetical protein VMG82_35530 [Candidatus Sulfotelmatobacter sp.]|nr:hypothetical protein [Candidatus Sulfotelmatobacter sp.]
MTNQSRIATRIVIAAIALTSLAALAQTDAQKAFATIKTLPGTWEGDTKMGPVTVTFKSTAGGSAVMSEILGKEDMVTMFNLDGPSRLLMTHYCAAGNEPRMEASVAPDGKVITFNFVDATNLATPDAGHMQKMVLTLIDSNHHTEEWTFVDHGKEHREVFDLHRKS